MSASGAVSAEHNALHAKLSAAAQSLQLAVSSAQSARLVEFVDLLSHWNRTYNLTAIRDTAGILTHHVVDCLAAMPPLRRELSGRASPRVLDVGSGGGLPGLIFAVMEPRLDVMCIDSVGKKTAFIRQAAATLKLDNLEVVHGRIEKLKAPHFNVITSRAFASLADFTCLTAGLLDTSGVWMAMKGRTPDDEIQALPASVRVFHVEPLEVPDLNAERCLVWMRECSSV